MADSQFNPLGTVTAPADWTLPASLNLLLKNVYASYDGTGAAGSFQPCLQIVSDSGHTVGSYPCATTVAAGASADVTWFPVRGGTSGGSAPAGAAIAFAYIIGSATRVCNSGVNTLLTASAAHFYTNSPTIFGHGTDGSGNVGITIKSNGHYWSVATVTPFGIPTVGSHWITSQLGGGNIAGNDYLNFTPLNPNGTVTDDWETNDGLLTTVGGAISPPTAPIIVQINNDGAHNVTMGGPQVYVWQIDTDSTDLF